MSDESDTTDERRVVLTSGDWTEVDSISTAVTSAVARLADVEATDLEPLARSVDPDALEALFRPTFDGHPRPGGRVTFPFAGYEVTVRADGTVVARPREADDE